MSERNVIAALGTGSWLSHARPGRVVVTAGRVSRSVVGSLLGEALATAQKLRTGAWSLPHAE
ncbi:hypothetical protein KDA_77160 [Dictyobacter alpinus]|uniref:Uncharacterized protein n=1 Tax=Dictyobacter alpinus TaxID=2014873 RepID=A0A402BLL6_9CHLR|nr:hypothetical protein [Dictyobacter alpinus]GCE32232.1 hypothetical protein KDA_77160 [Dictyobacter alpinus]